MSVVMAGPYALQFPAVVPARTVAVRRRAVTRQSVAAKRDALPAGSMSRRCRSVPVLGESRQVGVTDRCHRAEFPLVRQWPTLGIEADHEASPSKDASSVVRRSAVHIGLPSSDRAGSSSDLVLAVVAYPRLDKPRPVTYTKALPQSITHPNGVVQSHQVLPALDTDGKQLWARPRSTLFFVPAQFVWVLCLAAALVLALIGLFV
jgi:hypothetical protein